MSPRPQAPDFVRARRALDVGLLADLPVESENVAGVSVTKARPTTELELDARITVWSLRAAAGDAAPRPSPSLASEPEFLERVAEKAQRVRFETDGDMTRAQVPFPRGTPLYGLGEIAGGLVRNGRLAEFWNTDAWSYGEDTEAVYQSHPFALALLEDGRSVGVLADCIRRGTVLVAEDGLEFSFEGGPFDVYLIDAKHPREVIRALSALIGPMPLPPRWALGYHQCRYSYMSSEEVREIARGFERHDLPCDALWLDIDYMDRFRVFTVDHERFGDLPELTEELRAEGLRTVAILDPGLARDEEYEVYRVARDRGHLVTRERGSEEPALGRVWPGVCAFPDFTSSDTRAYWAELTADFVKRYGIDGLWNDMNEPALFRCPRRSLSDRAWHPGAERHHDEVHNVYGDGMVRASRAGLQQAYPERRPFVLTRAAHLATSNAAATWTGDNQSCWEDLAWAIPMVLNLSMSGQPFCGPDIGGFYGDPDEELFVRWFEVGALLPFCRGHGEKSSARKEPWSFGDVAVGHIRSLLRLRMQLMPYLFGLFARVSQAGGLIAQPLFFADPGDARLHTVEDAFLLGGDLLVAPVTKPSTDRRPLCLPKGGWYDFHAPAKLLEDAQLELSAPLGTLPLMVRAGSILATCAPHRNAANAPHEVLLLAFLDAEGKAEGCLYVDLEQSLEIGTWHTLRVEEQGGSLQANWPEGEPSVPYQICVHRPDGSSQDLRQA